MRRTVPSTLVAAGAALALLWPTAPVSAAPAPAAEGDRRDRDIAQHALRAGVTDDSFYFVMADRFANGDPANDTGGIEGDKDEHGFDPTAKGYFNGGDLDGLRAQLDYIEGLGTDAIWLTPVFKNKAVQLEDGPSAGYHGYWITDFTRIDPHLGTNADLTELVEAAHDRGIKVFFDIITNHTADVIGYEEGARTAYVPKDVEPYRTADGTPFDDRDHTGGGPFPELDPATSFPYTPVLEPGEEDLKVPAWLNDPTLYHNRGNTTFTGEDSQYGDFFGLDDLFTEHPRVVDGMIDIYRTWVEDFGIDGFRIDTMKHVDDAFWQEFGPGLLDFARSHGNPDFFMFGEVALDGSDAAAKAFTSHYTTHDGMQAILDFPFQWAARDFVSKEGSGRALARFFRDDDWYTDADSNVHSLPTFLGNHDMGRFGHFLAADDAERTPEELLRRDVLGHELMYLSRGNPVVYYGDEQGFTGTGGDQLARQSMFASQVPEYVDDDQLGTDETPATDSLDTDHPLYGAVAGLDRLVEQHPALRRGAQQVRVAGEDVVAFSRIERRQQREYVVVLNTAEQRRSVRVPTWVDAGRFRKVHGAGPASLRSARDGDLRVTAPPLGAVVYASVDRIPASRKAPSVRLARPTPTKVARSRTEVTAKVGGDSFYEVSFQAKVGNGRWRDIGTDDSAPYRVFHDTRDLATGTKVTYRAAVLDNRGHSRVSGVRTTRVAPPTVDVTTSGTDGTVSNVDPVTVTATVDPERPGQSVRFERRVGDGAWTVIGTDTSSPAYTVRDDVSGLPLGTRVRYRAVLLEPGTPRVVGGPVTVTTAAPTPARESVAVAGSLQDEIGCAADWDPACEESRLAFDPTDGRWHATFELPAGTYEWKVAVDGSWDENYGAGGAAGGDNLVLEVPEGGATYRFTWDQVSHEPSATLEP
ncbi:alpha-amylase family glycosyl hydrolase [Nocardioides abyssi]|uniref:Alpha-amylase family glycosyl hydrolase n=1 Tax=Nocardioides abyssi TaxID=3058370 RepID=A0ABT8EWE9_9ACTN|nr:alpha-amylase family glycosyl hydrolase [Nocardioides abyssi]MDN4162437.1 alpha-amylase family glycosyl hydrolase [Nocardioides abyssi]